ncbi:hypothetical protein M7I_1447 [Glarea lozoyensis 74030]|uniref:Uncharacterized protein n=1 Tax=Glarea lozoyensis (strain ATCC 74030 / MF5533) TaxID=1104152 RepID=H0EG39_GLAL7|nr:hypothetical protein M7I_1447 [Glarea lozoyensis 74030]
MSNVARTLAALSLAMMASAQIIVMPTNATLPSDEQSSLVPLTLLGGPLFQKQSPYNIAPLTEVAGKGKPVEQINLRRPRGFEHEPVRRGSSSGKTNPGWHRALQ